MSTFQTLNTGLAYIVALVVVLIAFTGAFIAAIRYTEKKRPAGKYASRDDNDPANYECLAEWSLYTKSEDPMGEYRERITGAAIKHGTNGLIYLAYPPLRHHNVINNFMAPQGVAGGANVNGKHQGFVTSHGRFVDRREGLRVAEGARQVVCKLQPMDKLCTEDMW